MNVTVPELMAVAMARAVRDHDFVAVGAASHVPSAAMRLALLTHAPNASWLSGGSGAINPHTPELYASTSDYRNLLMGEAWVSQDDNVDFQCSMRLDLAFLGGMQIDRYGNVNMAVIGDWECPTVRGPGAVGTIFMGGFKRVILFTERHEPRTFVEKVDFITGPGFLTGGDARAKVLRPESTGPQLVVTPLAVMDFEPDAKAMRLRSTHPGVDVQDVQDATGFELLLADDVGVTPEPSPEELAVLRELVDPGGLLRS